MAFAAPELNPFCFLVGSTTPEDHCLVFLKTFLPWAIRRLADPVPTTQLNDQESALQARVLASVCLSMSSFSFGFQAC